MAKDLFVFLTFHFFGQIIIYGFSQVLNVANYALDK